MATFDSDGVLIDYLDDGEGPAVVLVHGFASNQVVNWVNTTWVTHLKRAGYRVIALDNRGHGKSQKLYDPALYSTDLMADDVVRLIDHLTLDRPVVMGYSMGARIAAFTALKAPQKLRGLVLSGLASNLVNGVEGGPRIAEALEAPSLDDVSGQQPRMFRAFAEQTGGDLKALASCIRASRQTLSAADVARIAVPTLVVAGADDEIAGSAEALAALIPGARALTIPGRDHMSAVGDRTHKAEVVNFLGSLAN
ncbi:alpha/beta fold hydrolase [Acuticoccus mangrovi]|uniref:Alpha/beta hydrolase n=1 Tax=Acuticoccus mangrovi TaxID=2796142 RepID=A0A934IJU0_9HYPH|nr:alpha/beta hydrolase [Acuticoccus mangrovi]MBJ3776311.1 alpha/beta hydrolase [Acuticoccus mangrovi]